MEMDYARLRRWLEQRLATARDNAKELSDDDDWDIGYSCGERDTLEEMLVFIDDGAQQ